MWIYERLKHTLTKAGDKLEFTNCYCGNGEGLNNPEMEAIHDVGPLPAGIYDMTSFINSSRTGTDTIVLIAKNSSTQFGRDGFRIHGDNSKANFTASDGCIILTGSANRATVWNSQDRVLLVE